MNKPQPKIEYQLRVSKRRTLAIQVKQAQVIVRAPYGCPQRDIDAFLQQKQRWILHHLTVQQEKMQQQADFVLQYGSQVLLRGVWHTILAHETQCGFVGETVYVPPGLSGEVLRQTLVTFYREQAQQLIPQRVAQYAARMGYLPANVQIGSATTRWGSCSANGSLRFSWRLILASDEVIDYVVVHELAHLQQMNHSPAFWAIVAEFIPEYALRRRALRALEDRIINQKWNLKK